MRHARKGARGVSLELQQLQGDGAWTQASADTWVAKSHLSKQVQASLQTLQLTDSNSVTDLLFTMRAPPVCTTCS